MQSPSLVFFAAVLVAAVAAAELVAVLVACCSCVAGLPIPSVLGD